MSCKLKIYIYTGAAVPAVNLLFLFYDIVYFIWYFCSYLKLIWRKHSSFLLKYFQTYLIFNIILTHAFPVREMRRSGVLLIFLVSNFSAVNENFDKITRWWPCLNQMVFVCGSSEAHEPRTFRLFSNLIIFDIFARLWDILLQIIPHTALAG